MVSLDTFNDNSFVSLALHRRGLGDAPSSKQTCCERAWKELLLKTAPLNVGKTSLDELDKVERHLNQAKELGIRLAWHQSL